MGEERIERAVDEVVRCRLSRTPLGKLVGIDRDDLGYAVQARANRRLSEFLGRAVGHKIGATDEALRKMLGAAEPLAGEIFGSTVQQTPGRYGFADFRKPGIETEIAVRLARDLPADDAPFDRTAVAAAVEVLIPAIELVDNRYTDLRSVGVPTILADNTANAGSVLGPPRADWLGLDLAALRARTWIDGELVAEGTGDAVMGHPLEALTWLANRRAALGRGLAAGDFVSLGTITPVQWLSGPASARIEIEELGEVEVRIA